MKAGMGIFGASKFRPILKMPSTEKIIENVSKITTVKEETPVVVSMEPVTPVTPVTKVPWYVWGAAVASIALIGIYIMSRKKRR